MLVELFGRIKVIDDEIIIRSIYNRGNIKANDKNNGGIIGGGAETINDISKIKIMYSFNVGKNSSKMANQIVPNYATVTDSYYPTMTVNKSGYGISLPLRKFLYIPGETDMVYKKLRDAEDVWGLDPELNIILAWQMDGWQFE